MSILPPYDGRVIITWPRPGTAGVLDNRSVTFHDADTGEQILTGLKVSIVMGTDTGYEGACIEAEITALADADGRLLGAGQPLVPVGNIYDGRARSFTPERQAEREQARATEAGDFRTGVFRYLVAEMRTTDPAVPTARSVAEGRHTVNELQEHLGRQQLEAWELAGVKPAFVFRPDPGNVLTVTCPDDWCPLQVQEFHDHLSRFLPDQRIVMVPDSVGLGFGPTEADAE